MPELRIDVNASSSSARRELAATRNEVDRFGKSADTVGRQSEKSRGRVSKWGTALRVGAISAAGTAVVAAGAGIVRFGVDSVRAASDVQQAFGAVDAVFGRNASTVKRWATSAASDLGLAKSEYGQMAAVIGASLKNSGIEDYTGKTRMLIRTGADLAAQFGGSTSDAVEALGSLLRGEMDPIERYGVSIKQSDVNARLAALGQNKLTGAARKQAEMQARLALVTRQTKDAQGAFRRESGTLANQQQRLKANFENVKSTLGRRLTPALTKALGAVNKLMSGEGKLGGQTRSLARIQTSFLTPALRGVKRGADDAGRGFRRAGGSSKGWERTLRILSRVARVAAGVAGDNLGRAMRVAGYAAGVAAASFSNLVNSIARVVGWALRAIGVLDRLRNAAANGRAAFNAGKGLLRTGAPGGLARARGHVGAAGYGRSQSISLTSRPSVVIDVDSKALAKIFRVIVKDELRQLTRAGEAVV